MTRRASFNSLAEAELVEAVCYYESESPGLGRRFLLAVEAAIAQVTEHPLAGSPLGSHVRRSPVSQFPYQLLYRVEEVEIRFLALMHKRRRPNYWVQRH